MENLNSENLSNPNSYNLDDIEKKWKDIEPAYRNEYPTLTEEDVKYREGEFDDMIHRVARRTNRSRELVLEDIRDWHENTI